MIRVSPWLLLAFIGLFGLAGYRVDPWEPGPKPVHPRIIINGSHRYHPPKHGRLGYRPPLRYNRRGMTYLNRVKSGGGGGSGSYIAQAAPSGEGLTYRVYYDGTYWNFVNQNTGVTDYKPSTAASALTDLGTILNNGTSTYPVEVYLGREVSLSGQLKVSGSSWTLASWSRGGFGSSLPYIKQITLGISGTSTTMEGVFMAGLSYGELDLTNNATTGSGNAAINGVEVYGCTVLAAGGSGACGIVIDTSLGSGYIDYVYFTGTTIINHGNSSATGGTYPGGGITFKGANNGGTDQIGFHHIMLTNTGGISSSSTCSLFHWYAGTYNGRIQCGPIELNWNGAEQYAVVCQHDSGSTATTNVGIFCTQLSIENHIAAGGGCYIYQFGVNSGGVTTGFVIESLLVTYCANVSVSLVNDAGTTFNNSVAFDFLYVGAAQCLYVSGGASTWVAWGTFVEKSNTPVYFGPANYVSGAFATALSTGCKIADPVTSAGAILSIGGTAAVSTSAYKVGGTPLIAYLSGGTITLESPDGTTYASAVTSARCPYVLQPGTTVTFGTAADVTILKGV